MRKQPAIPKSRRNLNDLDELIDQSLGQKEANYHQMFASTAAKPTADTDESSTQVDAPTSLTQARSPILQPVAANDDPVERFQLDISRSVIVATKYEGVLKKTSASKIVELALRQYLNLPSKT